MKSPLRWIFGTALVILFLALGFLWAFPWDRLAESALVRAAESASSAGTFVSFGEVVGKSRIPPRIECRDLEIRNLLGKVRIPSAFLQLDLVDSALALGPSIRVESPGATLELPGNPPLRLGTVQARIVGGRQLTRLDISRMEGELSVSGWAAWPANGKRPSQADLLVKAPPSLAPTLQVLGLSSGLKPAGDGQWRLRLP
jgi:hypothetical protein